jgi:glycerate dehydrogenase
MKETIIVTDGATLNPGDLSWKPFEKFGKLMLHDRTRADEVASICKGASVIVTNKTPINARTIEAAPALKIIAVTATGYNIVDTAAARMRGIIVCNVPGYGTNSVAQHTFALMLELANHVGKNASSVAAGDWAKSPDFCYSLAPIQELAGKKLGIIGLGKIGSKVADIARAFEMEVCYHSPSRKTEVDGHVSLHELFSTSDFVSLHCPLRKDNNQFVNRGVLSVMKPSAYLINTSRGQLIHEDDLRHALTRGLLAGAALDVLSVEPPPVDHPLVGLPNCLITPHNAWLSLEARQRIMETTFINVSGALAGKPLNVVD